MNTNFLSIVLKYKTYLLLIFIMILFFILYTPIKNRTYEYVLSKTDYKKIEREYQQLSKKYKQNTDSIEFYKLKYQEQVKITDSSKQNTIKIIKINNEEVNNIRYIPFDSNVIKFESDLEEYIANRFNTTNISR